MRDESATGMLSLLSVLAEHRKGAVGRSMILGLFPEGFLPHTGIRFSIHGFWGTH